ncbi:MAG: SocA family protein [Methanosphaera sp.]|nr:SocA family protein [Methanosphaera sp.]
MNEDITLNIEKFKDVIHYVISKCEHKESFTKNVLYKLLYFNDFNYYELYEESLTGEKYLHKFRGPVPIDFDEAITQLIEDKRIKENKEMVITFPKYTYQSLTEPPMENLTQKEINVIEENILKLSDMSSAEISNYSHGDRPWRISDEDEELNYEAVFYRKPEYSVRDYSEV